nr:PREDICTED: uncharacterized protein LOC108204149 [Daucus carota subsp. sativus]
MTDDILYERRKASGNPTPILTDEEVQNHALGDVHQLLKGVGKSLSDFPMLPQPPPIYLNTGTNNLILDDTNYNVEDMRSEYEALINNCNEEQLKVYQEVMHSLEKK